MAQPVLDPLPPLWPDEPPRVLITLSPVPGYMAADQFVRKTGGVDGKLVVVDCRNHRHPRPTFVERFVRRLFDEGAAGIDFAVPLDDLWDLAVEVAESIGKRDKIRRFPPGILRDLVPGF